MPVGTQATVKAVAQRDLSGELDARIILANTYHLFLRPGHELIANLGGLHGFMSWPRAILTDSGGFQVWSLSQLRKVKDEGVEFQSHLDGDRHLFTPESVVDVQLAFNSDILMMLDECTEYPATREQARRSMERTIGWAGRGYARYLERMQSRPPGNALFPIVQGSMFADLRQECARSLVDLDADGYAIGGLSVGEPRGLSLEMTEATTPLLPAERPRYVMGVGMPEELPEYVARGVDMMDCVLPSRNARNGCLFTSQGKLLIKQARYRDDARPLDANCGCYACRTFSRAYLRHLYMSGEILFSMLATLHNLWHYLDIMKRMRHAILLGTFPEFLKTARTLPAEA
jgi:queuine tRNA-ribosyltransferase